MEFSTGHNGTTELPQKQVDGVTYTDASLADVHENAQKLVRDQVRYGIEAERNGFDQVHFTEHHFQITGAEYSPNPLLTQTYVAAETEEIRLLQMANILPWHDPIRLAEMTAMLDVLSDGRIEVGIGRGSMPREAAILGQYWGGGVGDQEENRLSFEEKHEILLAAWTEDLFTYRGQFHHLPPKHVNHDNEHDIAFLEDEATEYGVDDVLDRSGQGPPKLKTMSVFPQPLQEPHPQLWQPITSERSLIWAARRGINVYPMGGSIEDLAEFVDVYHRESAAADWPDHRPEHDGEPFRKGWDEERRRGVVPSLSIFNTDVADEDAFERWKLGKELRASIFASQGAIPWEVAEQVFSVEADTNIYGDTEAIIEAICDLKAACDYDDYIMNVRLQGGGLTTDEMLAQMEAFADEAMPYLEEEFPSP